jgi:hypothetical protein
MGEFDHIKRIYDQLPPMVFPEDHARNEFLYFMRADTAHMPNPDDHGPDGMNYLMNYVHLWLIKGSAVWDTGGSYETFLFVIQRIIDAWVNDPRLIDSARPGSPSDPTRRDLKGVFHPDRVSNRAPSKYEYEYERFLRLRNDYS